MTAYAILVLAFASSLMAVGETLNNTESIILERAKKGEPIDGFEITYLSVVDNNSRTEFTKHIARQIRECAEREPFDEACLQGSLELFTLVENETEKKEIITSSPEKDLAGKTLIDKVFPTASLKLKKRIVSYLGMARMKDALPFLNELLRETSDTDTLALTRYSLFKIDLTDANRIALIDAALALPKDSETRARIAERLGIARDSSSIRFLARQIVDDPDLKRVGNLLRHREDLATPELVRAALERLATLSLDHDNPRIGDFLNGLNAMMTSEFEDSTEVAYVNAIKPYLLSEKPRVAHTAQKVFDIIVERQGGLREQSEFVRKHVAFPETATDACKTMCEIADRVVEWLRPEFYEQAEFDPKMKNRTWDFAVQSLSVLFLSKAAHYCPHARKFHADIIGRWASPEKLALATATTATEPLDEKQLALLRELANSLDPKSREGFNEFMGKVGMSVKGEMPLQASVVYGTAFYSLWLRELQSPQNSLDPALGKIVENAKKNSQTLLSKFGRYFKAARNDVDNRNSLFNTYAVATTLLALERPRQDHIEDLKKAIPDPEKPLNITYAPLFKKNEWHGDLRGAVARGPIVYLFLYRASQNSEEKARYRELLLQALDNFADFSDVLLLQSRRDGTHISPSDIAPYYFSGNMPYATDAWRTLLDEARNGEQDRLDKIGKRLKRAALLAVDGRGLAATHGKYNYPSSDAYNNPLLGLSLTALAKDCTRITPEAIALGIVDHKMKVEPVSRISAVIEDNPHWLVLGPAAVAAGVVLGKLLARTGCKDALQALLGRTRPSTPTLPPTPPPPQSAQPSPPPDSERASE